MDIFIRMSEDSCPQRDILEYPPKEASGTTRMVLDYVPVFYKSAIV
jgi:hypothetical protein